MGVVQPHRFTRLRDHMDDFQQAFNDADMVLALPVYAAGESPIEGVSSDSLAQGLRDRGHRHAHVVADADALAASIAASIAAGDIGAGDMIICLGAGDITRIAAGLAGNGGERHEALPTTLPVRARQADREGAAGTARLVQVGRPRRTGCSSRRTPTTYPISCAISIPPSR